MAHYNTFIEKRSLSKTIMIEKYFCALLECIMKIYIQIQRYVYKAYKYGVILVSITDNF